MFCMLSKTCLMEVSACLTSLSCVGCGICNSKIILNEENFKKILK